MASAPSSSPTRATALNIGLWLAQVLLCAGFVSAAWFKLMTPIPTLAAMWPWTGQLPEPVVRGLGLIDLAGGVGVLLPALTRILPRLTVPAALGCVTLQICASVFHASRGEFAALPVNAVFFALALFILWGRRRLPILPRPNRR